MQFREPQITTAKQIIFHNSSEEDNSNSTFFTKLNHSKITNAYVESSEISEISVLETHCAHSERMRMQYCKILTDVGIEHVKSNDAIASLRHLH